jgi:predicted dithiol-disulfide oxidoreductase (DUF899 family)
LVADGGGEVRFSELFEAGKDPLVVYSFMFPRSSGDTRPGLSSRNNAYNRDYQAETAEGASVLDMTPEGRGTEVDFPPLRYA